MTTTMTAEQARNASKIRKYIAAGREVELTRHSRTYAFVISPEQRAELDRLRAEVEDLRSKLTSRA